MSSTDKNFDTANTTFSKNIYGTSKGKIRFEVLKADLTSLINNEHTLNVIDIGGGQGQLALEFAKAGHNVTIVDVSQAMLDTAAENAQKLGLTNVRCINKPLQELSGDNRYDVVMCHAVFEWLTDPQSAFAKLNELKAKHGHISLMFYNQAGQVLSNLVYGNFPYIKAGMKAKKVVKLNPQSALKQETVISWVNQHGLKINTKSGVRCFHDYMRDITKWQEDFDGILEMELSYRHQSPYCDIARYIHLLLN